ncbi:uncharacterized protein M421DRAFT_173969 [Didymella exigua CBS 183.55]|uniref:Uncharacterized protein n=1 Tax=Didymella exigua CBS 183.55 TaxID=1150837 RepID=A0A6A5RHD0_9PLEO|nr:uncharacterized protein M421DRAFT_173969 [Didymella exigua CBS 183.55]KAF1927725.1 hypothetical protein M421DRAFT_173969 [Didymella exigua CBS 183.55]
MRAVKARGRSAPYISTTQLSHKLRQPRAIVQKWQLEQPSRANLTRRSWLNMSRSVIPQNLPTDVRICIQLLQLANGSPTMHAGNLSDRSPNFEECRSKQCSVVGESLIEISGCFLVLPIQHQLVAFLNNCASSQITLLTMQRLSAIVSPRQSLYKYHGTSICAYLRIYLFC